MPQSYTHILILIVIGYFVIINLVALIACYRDKQKAKNHSWRIKEFTLIMLAIVGGSIGLLSGMYMFHHKTKHKKFSIGVPVILAIQVTVAVYVIGILTGH